MQDLTTSLSSMIEIREATAHDAESGCAVVHRSISELCELDHHNDTKIIEQWLRNSTVENFVKISQQTNKSMLVATEQEKIVAVGLVTDGGVIRLNYVSPTSRFQGISRALLRALEKRAYERGCKSCNLVSTATARRFYVANGYHETGPATGVFGTTSGYPMSKSLG